MLFFRTSGKVIYFSSLFSSWRLPWVNKMLLFYWNSSLRVPFPEDNLPDNISTNISIQSIFQFWPHWMSMYTEQKPVNSTQITLVISYVLHFLWHFSKWLHDPKGSWRQYTSFLIEYVTNKFRNPITFYLTWQKLDSWL